MVGLKNLFRPPPPAEEYPISMTLRDAARHLGMDVPKGTLSLGAGLYFQAMIILELAKRASK